MLPRYLKTLFKLAFSLGLCGAFLWTAFRGVNLQVFWQEIRRADAFYLALSGGVLIFSTFPRAWRWKILMGPVAPDISLWRTSVAVLIGYAGNNLFPRAGEVARVLAIRKGRNLPISALLATVVVERALDMFALLLLFGYVLFINRQEIARVFPWMEGVGLIAFLLSMLLLVLFGLLSAYGDRALDILKRPLRRISRPLADRLIVALHAFFQGMGGIRTKAGYLEIALSTVILYAIYILSLYLTFLAFSFPDKYGLNFIQAIVVTVVSTTGVILPTPGGTGTYNLFCSQTLHHLYGVPLSEALALATAVHGIAYLSFLLLGGPGLLGLLIRRSSSGPLRSVPPT